MAAVNADDIKRIRDSKLFDEKWYLEQYPDVKALGMDPIEHYLWLGAKLGRDPAPNFFTRTYLSQKFGRRRKWSKPIRPLCAMGRKRRSFAG